MAKAAIDAETVGRLLFGSVLRLQVASWVLQRDDPVFYADQYFQETKHYSSQISKVCARLAQLEMVKKDPKLPPAPGTSMAGRCVYWRRIDSPLWDVVRSAVAATDRRRPQPSARTIGRIRQHLEMIELTLR